MAWPAGTKIAGKPYRHIQGAELGLAAPVNIAAASGLLLQAVPWWAGGFTKCRLQIAFTLAVAGNVQLLVIGGDSENGNLGVNYELLNGTTGDNFPGGFGSGLDITFDDGSIPGFYVPIQVIPQQSRGLNVNPVWNRAAFLNFTIQNLSAGNMQLNSVNFLLGA